MKLNEPVYKWMVDQVKNNPDEFVGDEDGEINPIALMHAATAEFGEATDVESNFACACRVKRAMMIYPEGYTPSPEDISAYCKDVAGLYCDDAEDKVDRSMMAQDVAAHFGMEQPSELILIEVEEAASDYEDELDDEYDDDGDDEVTAVLDEDYD